MPLVELIPLNKGNRIILDKNIITTIGRTPNIGCLDNKISRNHAQLFLKSDGTLWIKSIHYNPTFYKTQTNEIVKLTKDKEYQLFNNDQFGLLPDEYFYQVSIQPTHDQTQTNCDQNQTLNSSTIPKSPVKENEILTIENKDEDKSESSLHRNQTLPNGISNSSPSISNNLSDSNVSKEQTQKIKQIVANDDDEKEEPTTTASTTDQPSTSANNNLTLNSQTSSTIVHSTKRERCPYGDSCFRKNPIHRQQARHPGDSDWESENEDEDKDKDETKPECPYGSECYRKNPDHFNEYHHPKKRSVEIKTKRRSVKRKVSNIDDDDDGLPNEYDHTDSFIDDEDLGTTDDGTDEEETDVDDDEWKPTKKARYLNDTDDESTDDSDKELARREAAQFTKSSTADHTASVTKKPRLDDD